MRRVTTITLRVVIGLVAVYLVLLLLAHSVFIVARMGSSSMSPLIGSNDVVIATRLFHATSLHSGDLVLVALPLGGHDDIAVREIEQQTNTPAGQFYLEALSTNGVDSRFLGALPASDIRGRVLWIAKGS
jgi:type IV secretory pathway protease TraF